MAFELDLHGLKMNQRNRYLGQRSLRSNIIVQIHTPSKTHTHTHRTDGSNWTTKVVSRNDDDDDLHFYS